METNACRTPEQVEEHWRRMIAAVKGRAMAEVWYEFKFGPSKQPGVTNPPGPVQGGATSRAGGERPDALSS
jgi:hypothetical protein